MPDSTVLRSHRPTRNLRAAVALGVGLVLLPGCSPSETALPPGYATILYRVEGSAAPPGDGDLQLVATALRVRLRTVDPTAIRVDVLPGDTLRVGLPERLADRAPDVRRLAVLPSTLEIGVVPPADRLQEERRRKDAEGRSYVPPPEHRWVPDRDGVERLAAFPPQDTFTAADLGWAEAASQATEFSVACDLRPDRAPAFEAWSQRHLKRQVVFVIDDVVVTDPVIQSPLPGKFVVVGGGARGFSRSEAEALATSLRAAIEGWKLVEIGR